MKTRSIPVLVMSLFALVAMGCDVTQTQEAELPDVDVDVESGALPKFDVDWANVDVGTRTEMVKVPKVVVVMEEVEVEIPYIDVDMPGEDEARERTIAVELEISDENHEVEIQEVYATERRLIIVSRLTPTGDSLGDQRVRVSDRIVLNAPALDVRHYIIGAQPEGDWNSQYDFVSSRDEISDELANATRIYQR